MDDIFSKYIATQKTVGIGTGATIKRFISTIKGHNDILYVPSSLQSLLLLNKKKLSTQQLLLTDSVEIYFDSADYFDEKNNLIKGRGGALLNEKLLMTMSECNLILVDDKKFRPSFEDLLVPIEITKNSLAHFKSILKKEELEHFVREYPNKIGPVITEDGNLIIDVEYNLNFFKSCKNITGVVEHGLFLNEDFNITIERV